MPPESWTLFAADPPRPVRPVYDIPPVIRRKPRRRLFGFLARVSRENALL